MEKMRKKHRHPSNRVTSIIEKKRPIPQNNIKRNSRSKMY